MKTLPLAVGLSLALGLSAEARQATVPAPTEVVKWEAAASPRHIRAGETLSIRIRAEIAPGWSLYAMHSPAGRPLEISARRLPPGFRLVGKPKQSGVRNAFDANFGTDVLYFHAASEAEQRLKTDRRTAPGAVTVGGDITFMACNDRLCLSPVTVPFEAPVTVSARP